MPKSKARLSKFIFACLICSTYISGLVGFLGKVSAKIDSLIKGGENLEKLDDVSVLDGIVKDLREKGTVVELWESFSTFMDGLCQKTGVQRHSFCLELCTDTLQLEKEVRVHMHVFLSMLAGNE